jgi:hypothetical protein
VIEPNTSRDKQLLGAANLDGKKEGGPREASTFSFRTDQGEEYRFPIFIGFGASMPASIYYGMKIEAMSRFRAEQQAGRIKGKLVQIEYSHVHPALDVVATPKDREQPQLRFTHDLDRTDWVEGGIEESKSNSEVLWTIRAISPNGYSYRADFRNGRFVEPSPTIPQANLQWPVR